MSVRIRAGEEGDLDALVRIYNHYVTETHATFNTEPFTAEQRRPWLEGFSTEGPYRLLVADTGGTVAGYASSTRLRPKPAYDTSVETTIYLDPGHLRRGIGMALYGALLEDLEAEPSVHRAFGGIALPNPASVLLHERLGFTPVGTFHEVGYKHGRYHDVRWYERSVETAT